MDTKNRVIEIIDNFKQMHVNDPRFSDWFDEIVDLLSKDVSETINILEFLDKESIYWLTKTFEDVSIRLKSDNYINCIKALGEKYRSIEGIDEDIQDAIDILKD